MNAIKTTIPQISRWFDLLQDFDMEVKHRMGSTMEHVVALIRAPVEPVSDTMDQIISNRVEVLVGMNKVNSTQ